MQMELQVEVLTDLLLLFPASDFLLTHMLPIAYILNFSGILAAYKRQAVV